MKHTRELIDMLNEEELIALKRLVTSKLKQINTGNDAKGKLVRDSNTFFPGDFVTFKNKGTKILTGVFKAWSKKNASITVNKKDGSPKVLSIPPHKIKKIPAPPPAEQTLEELRVQHNDNRVRFMLPPIGVQEKMEVDGKVVTTTTLNQIDIETGNKITVKSTSSIELVILD